MPGARLLARAARRYGPAIAAAAYKRWQALTPKEKERYRRQMREYASRGREMARGAGRGRSGDRTRGRDDEGEGRPREPRG